MHIFRRTSHGSRAWRVGQPPDQGFFVGFGVTFGDGFGVAVGVADGVGVAIGGWGVLGSSIGTTERCVRGPMYGSITRAISLAAAWVAASGPAGSAPLWRFPTWITMLAAHIVYGASPLTVRDPLV